MASRPLLAKLARFVPAIAVAAVLSGAAAVPAGACDSGNQHTFGVSPGCFDMRIAAAPTSGDLAPTFTQAGGHPFEITTAIRFNAPSENHPVHGPYWPPEALKGVRLTLPAGLVANPNAVPSCKLAQLALEPPNCSSDAQIGVLGLHMLSPLGGVSPVVFESPIYRVDAPPEIVMRFGFGSGVGPSVFEASGSVDDISIDLENIGNGLSTFGMTLALWGVPAHPGHTPARACPGQIPPGAGFFGSGPSCAATVPERAFLRLPTSCTGPASVALRVHSWQNPDEFQTSTILTHGSPGLLGDPTASTGYPAAYPGLPAEQWGAPQGFNGCGQVPFNPSLNVRLDSGAAETPTGLELEVSFPQQGMDEPSAVAESDLRAAVMEFPAGLSLNPAVANGLSTCTAAQFGLGSSSEPTCPDSAKLGSVEISSTLLGARMKGSIYAAAPEGSESADIPAYLVARMGDLILKLGSSLEVDRLTGRIAARFENVPQVPIANLRMRFFGGDRAPFISPPNCGLHASEGRFSPWSGGKEVSVRDSFEIDSGMNGGPCIGDHRERPFRPGFSAGVTSAVAGAGSVLAVELTRNDGEQAPRSFQMSLPPGLAASLRGVSTCADATADALAARAGTAELTTPSCPPGSRLGSVRAALGVGIAPLLLDSGTIYLAGPYEGSQFSFLVVLPVVAGPLDLNTLVMRMPLRLNPSDGRLRFQAEFPTRRNGIPFHLRRLQMQIDRPGFLSNPTNCRARSIVARIGGDGGAVADLSTPFQIIGCSSLRFAPRLRIRLRGGRPATRHEAHPGIRAVLQPRRGNAHLSSARIVFPRSQQMDAAHIRSICSRSRFAAGRCPPGSVYGHATVFSPMLENPLRGRVFLRNSQRKLPDLVADLRGQFDLQLRAKVGFAKGRLILNMDSLPDLPVSKLILTMAGGRRGVFVNNRDLCDAPSFSAIRMRAQNGKMLRRVTRLGVPCR